MNKVLTVFLVLTYCSGIVAQKSKVEGQFDYYLEIISELDQRNEEETDFNDLAYQLFELWESPININKAEPNDLGRLFWLTELQLNKLIGYVQKQGPVVSIYELAYLPGFDSTLVRSLEPFITISSESGYSRKAYPKHWVMMRSGRTLQQQKGFREKKFEGDAWKQNLRYKFQYGEKVFAGFNLEKDAGETIFQGSNHAGPDFYSAYIKVNEVGRFKTICLGNYHVGFGQGLVAGPGFSLGKSSQAVNLVQKEAGVRAYTSNDENRSLRGVASTIQFNPVELSVFFSFKKVDANITAKDSSGKVLEVSSLQTTGYHSTASEISDEDALREITAGGRILFKKARFQAGATFLGSSFGASILPKLTDYNQFYFRGNKQCNFGVDYKLNFSNTTLFGEEAMDFKGNTAFLNGITTNIGGRLQFSLLHRFYSKAYHAFYGNAFGENSRIQNEEGIYGGIRMALVKKVNLAFYADFYRFPWLKSGVDAPSYGREFMVQAEVNPNSAFSVYLQFRYKQKLANFREEAAFTNSLVLNQNTRFRIHLNYRAAENISLATRFERGFYNREGSSTDKSYLFYQDLRFGFLNLPLQLNLRYAAFRTDSYDSRIYAYESDVLYAFSVNAYFNEGQRYYAMMRYSPGSKIDIWVRYSQSVYPHEETISSGLYEITGNTRSDIRLQVVFKF